MSTGVQIMLFLVKTFATLYLTIILLRLLFQIARADFYNPICQAIVKATNSLVMPFRKIIPGLWGIDLATLVVAITFHLIIIVIILLILGNGLFIHPIIVLWAIIGVVFSILSIYTLALLVVVVSSWIAPYSTHPILVIIRQLVTPITEPFRKIIPPMGGLDLSILFVFVTINVLNIALRGLAINLGMPVNHITLSFSLF